MSNDLLHYYERELAWLKQAGRDFAHAHPAIAANLLSADGNTDPQMAHLVEAIAFLNARIQQQLDDDFPAITDALLEHLYPHYLAPLPSMVIVEMTAPEGLERAVTIAARSTIEVPGSSGTACKFSTIYPVTLLPYRLAAAELRPRPFHMPIPEAARNAVSILRLQFATSLADFSLAQSSIDHLQLFIRAPSQHAWRLHELMTCHCLHIAIAHGDCDAAPVELAAHNVRAMGFGDGETMLPGSDTSQPAYHYLTDFFCFPDKFLFVELRGLAAASIGKPGNFCVSFYLDASERDLERNLCADFFSLTATPAINLFPHTAEPIRLVPHCMDYPLVPDIRELEAYEVYSVEHVERIDSISGERTSILPFFGLTHDGRGCRQFWHHRRQLVRRGRGNEPGFDSFIAFSDQTCDGTNDDDDAVMHVSLLCSNRNLPSKLPTAELPGFQLRQNPGRVHQIRALTTPTTVTRLNPGNNSRWRLLSQLNLNLAGLLEQPDAAHALRNMLRLYDYADSATTRALIDAIVQVQCTCAMAQLRDGKRAILCRGIDVCVTLDETLLVGTSITLYLSILEHFLAQSVSINSFVRVSARLRGRQEIFKRWPARAGTRPVL
jgi:type VI secretion system protein ImpG